MCAGVCPTAAIEIIYYDYPSLLGFVEKQIKELNKEDLIVMCRGSVPPTVDVNEFLGDGDVRRPIECRLPCVGRVQAEFYLRAFALGVRKIYIVQCEERFCRFQKGSAVNQRQIGLLKSLMRGLSIDENRLTLIRNTVKVEYDSGACVGCDKCEYICPEDAIEVRPLSTPQVHFDRCTGCGACALVCPHLALQLRGYEFRPFSMDVPSWTPEKIHTLSIGDRPRILVLCCQWAEFSGLDALNASGLQGVKVVEIPCFNALDPTLVIEALKTDFDGVLALVCAEDQCKNRSGRTTAGRNATALSRILRNLDLAGRFEVCVHSPMALRDFSDKIEAFTSKIGLLSELVRD